MPTLQFHVLKGATNPYLAMFVTPRGTTIGEGKNWLEAMGVAIERSVAVGDIDLPLTPALAPAPAETRAGEIEMAWTEVEGVQEVPNGLPAV